MTAHLPSLTVNDVLKQALPLGSTVVAAAGSMARTVRWVVTARAGEGVSLPYLEGGELVLLVPGLEDMTTTIQACSAADAAGIACSDPVAALALAAAEIAGLPVIQLPTNCQIRDVERMALGLLLDRQGHLERRSAQIYQQLVQLASENAGLERIVHEMGRITGRTIVVQDKHLRIQTLAVSPDLAAGWDDIAELLTDRNSLPGLLRDRHRLPRHTSSVVRQPLYTDGPVRLIAPIVNQNVGRGYLSMIALSDIFGDVDTLVLSHAAVVCALEMARAKAISEIEKKLRGDFLDGLMIGSVGEAEAVAEGDRFGHDMSVPHVALVLLWYGNKHPSNRRLETLVNGLISGHQSPLLSQLRENELRLFFANDSSTPVQAARQFAEEIHAEVKREYPDAHVAIGIGSAVSRVGEWRVSYREAHQAADIAHRLRSETPMFIGDLGIYTFLAHPDYREDLRVLRDNTIGSLIEYEERQRADLLVTLEAFFQCHGNHTQTAEVLSVHRNTLFYRMNRIAEITGLDLNRPDVRLAVHLALKIHRLLTADA